MLTAGTRAILREDGLQDLVEVVTDTSTDSKLEYDLKLIRHLNHGPDHCAIDDGSTFHVFQRTDSGAWGGMWDLSVEDAGGL